MNFPIFCACGKPVLFSNETRCEDCYANDMVKFKVGKSKPTYAEQGRPPEPDNTYEILCKRD